jgi:hypothetical protein
MVRLLDIGFEIVSEGAFLILMPLLHIAFFTRYFINESVNVSGVHIM